MTPRRSARSHATSLHFRFLVRREGKEAPFSVGGLPSGAMRLPALPS